MEAKEKAQELVNKFKDYVLDKDFFGDNIETQMAKQCALIAVDEIIKLLDEISIAESGTTKIDYGQSFFEEVKNEINNL